MAEEIKLLTRRQSFQSYMKEHLESQGLVIPEGAAHEPSFTENYVDELLRDLINDENQYQDFLMWMDVRALNTPTGDINAVLFGDMDRETPETIALTETLDRSFQHETLPPLPETLYVYRTFIAGGINQQYLIDNPENIGFCSTTLIRDYATSLRRPGSYTIVIVIPQGTKIIPLALFPDLRRKRLQFEILLDRKGCLLPTSEKHQGLDVFVYADKSNKDSLKSVLTGRPADMIKVWRKFFPGRPVPQIIQDRVPSYHVIPFPQGGGLLPFKRPLWIPYLDKDSIVDRIREMRKPASKLSSRQSSREKRRIQDRNDNIMLLVAFSTPAIMMLIPYIMSFFIQFQSKGGKTRRRKRKHNTKQRKLK